MEFYSPSHPTDDNDDIIFSSDSNNHINLQPSSSSYSIWEPPIDLIPTVIHAPTIPLNDIESSWINELPDNESNILNDHDEFRSSTPSFKSFKRSRSRSIELWNVCGTKKSRSRSRDVISPSSSSVSINLINDCPRTFIEDWDQNRRRLGSKSPLGISRFHYKDPIEYKQTLEDPLKSKPFLDHDQNHIVSELTEIRMYQEDLHVNTLRDDTENMIDHSEFIDNSDSFNQHHSFLDINNSSICGGRRPQLIDRGGINVESDFRFINRGSRGYFDAVPLKQNFSDLRDNVPFRRSQESGRNKEWENNIRVRQNLTDANTVGDSDPNKCLRIRKDKVINISKVLPLPKVVKLNPITRGFNVLPDDVIGEETSKNVTPQKLMAVDFNEDFTRENEMRLFEPVCESNMFNYNQNQWNLSPSNYLSTNNNNRDYRQMAHLNDSTEGRFLPQNKNIYEEYGEWFDDIHTSKCTDEANNYNIHHSQYNPQQMGNFSHNVNMDFNRFHGGIDVIPDNRRGRFVGQENQEQEKPSNRFDNGMEFREWNNSDDFDARILFNDVNNQHQSRQNDFLQINNSRGGFVSQENQEQENPSNPSDMEFRELNNSEDFDARIIFNDINKQHQSRRNDFLQIDINNPAFTEERLKYNRNVEQSEASKSSHHRSNEEIFNKDVVADSGAWGIERRSINDYFSSNNNINNINPRSPCESLNAQQGNRGGGFSPEKSPKCVEASKPSHQKLIVDTISVNMAADSDEEFGAWGREWNFKKAVNDNNSSNDNNSPNKLTTQTNNQFQQPQNDEFSNSNINNHPQYENFKDDRRGGFKDPGNAQREQNSRPHYQNPKERTNPTINATDSDDEFGAWGNEQNSQKSISEKSSFSADNTQFKQPQNKNFQKNQNVNKQTPTKSFKPQLDNCGGGFAAWKNAQRAEVSKSSYRKSNIQSHSENRYTESDEEFGAWGNERNLSNVSNDRDSLYDKNNQNQYLSPQNKNNQFQPPQNTNIQFQPPQNQNNQFQPPQNQNNQFQPQPNHINQYQPPQNDAIVNNSIIYPHPTYQMFPPPPPPPPSQPAPFVPPPPPIDPVKTQNNLETLISNAGLSKESLRLAVQNEDLSSETFANILKTATNSVISRLVEREGHTLTPPPSTDNPPRLFGNMIFVPPPLPNYSDVIKLPIDPPPPPPTPPSTKTDESALAKKGSEPVAASSMVIDESKKLRSQFNTKNEWQERVALEVKRSLRPAYMARTIDKNDYKDIMRRCVIKITRSGVTEINSEKTEKFVLSYIDKYNRARRPKQHSSVSSSVAPVPPA